MRAPSFAADDGCDGGGCGAVAVDGDRWLRRTMGGWSAVGRDVRWRRRFGGMNDGRRGRDGSAGGGASSAPSDARDALVDGDA